ncbi:hypothetical protein FA15DRAFT_660387 [Coprinopsis marcescibilis]|uniref:Uncharacterized protein n=1 Tax=Coprinopsis marcescibilis TaxID=230819 RepID=A0A5C3KFR8_COPMA|nr:hypothetical protein FA15DRAFT_660387 [Coprinopsis marcescibilis]
MSSSELIVFARRNPHRHLVLLPRDHLLIAQISSLRGCVVPTSNTPVLTLKSNAMSAVAHGLIEMTLYRHSRSGRVEPSARVHPLSILVICLSQGYGPRVDLALTLVLSFSSLGMVGPGVKIPQNPSHPMISKTSHRGWGLDVFAGLRVSTHCAAKCEHFTYVQSYPRPCLPKDEAILTQ